MFLRLLFKHDSCLVFWILKKLFFFSLPQKIQKKIDKRNYKTNNKYHFKAPQVESHEWHLIKRHSDPFHNTQLKKIYFILMSLVKAAKLSQAKLGQLKSSSFACQWLSMQSGIFARKYVNKNSLSNHKKLMFLSLIAFLQHLLTVAIKENERIGDRNGDFF